MLLLVTSQLEIKPSTLHFLEGQMAYFTSSEINRGDSFKFLSDTIVTSACQALTMPYDQGVGGVQGLRLIALGKHTLATNLTTETLSNYLESNIF